MNFSKYKPYLHWRPGQEKAIQSMLDLYQKGNEIISLNSPTASGKSGILYTFGKILEKEFELKKIIYTSPQVVLIESGTLFDLPRLTGKRNYNCLGLNKCTAEECPFNSKEEGFSVCQECSYRLAKQAFNASDFSAVTLARYLVDPNIYSKTKVLLVDESSELENSLLNKATIELNLKISDITKKKTIKEQVVDIQKYLDTFDVKSHLQTRNTELHLYTSKLGKQCTEYRSEVFKGGHHPNSVEIKRLKSIQQEYNKYHRDEMSCSQALRYIGLKVPYCLVTDIQETWNPMLRKKEVSPVPYFKLLDSHALFNDLAANLDCIVLASGTPTTELLTSKYQEVKVLHPISVDRRLIHYDPVGSMNLASREYTAERMAQRIKQLHDTYSRHTIVHAGSYAVARLIMDHLSRLHPNTVLQEQGWREEALADWQKRDDAIFLSVKYEEGISLDGPEYPMNIIAKIAFPNMGDLWIQARNKLDNWYYYNLLSCVSTMQAAGRTTRGPNDMSETWILDQSFGSLLSRNKKLFAPWFLEALRF
jgi:ATP-dependent DNA helicase DinG